MPSERGGGLLLLERLESSGEALLELGELAPMSAVAFGGRFGHRGFQSTGVGRSLRKLLLEIGDSPLRGAQIRGVALRLLREIAADAHPCVFVAWVDHESAGYRVRRSTVAGVRKRSSLSVRDLPAYSFRWFDRTTGAVALCMLASEVTFEQSLPTFQVPPEWILGVPDRWRGPRFRTS